MVTNPGPCRPGASCGVGTWGWGAALDVQNAGVHHKCVLAWAQHAPCWHFTDHSGACEKRRSLGAGNTGKGCCNWRCHRGLSRLFLGFSLSRGIASALAWPRTPAVQPSPSLLPLPPQIPPQTRRFRSPLHSGFWGRFHGLGLGSVSGGGGGAGRGGLRYPASGSLGALSLSAAGDARGEIYEGRCGVLAGPAEETWVSSRRSCCRRARACACAAPRCARARAAPSSATRSCSPRYSPRRP